MAGIDENVAWTTPADPSPRSFFASFMSDDLLSERESGEPFIDPDKRSSTSVDRGGDAGMEASGVPVSESHFLSIPKPTSRSGLAERMAARGGFNALKLNTAQIKPTSLRPSSPDSPSPYLMLSPGLSPTILLESPVFLFNSLAQPSPTTGKFPVGHCTNSSSMLVSEHTDKNKEMHNEPFAFKPHLESNSSYYSTAVTKMDAPNDQQPPLPSIMVSVQPGKPNRAGAIDTSTFSAPNDQEAHFQSVSSNVPDKQDPSGDFTFNQEAADSALGNENSPALIDQLEGEEQKGDISSFAVGQPSEDGYNWRKYGQKQVKGSEFPRSYYKCTHPNCQVKKVVERSPEGHVTEIIYKGVHGHPKPPLNRRAAGSSSHPFGEIPMDDLENHCSQPNIEGMSMWATQNGTAGSDWRGDGMEAPSCTTVTADFCESSFNTQDIPRFDGADAIDVSSTLSNEEEDDHENRSIGEGDESESKRRKLDVSVMDVGAASRAVREPRVVVQTTSEVDILDDGYRWRKYGQKVVKGNPNPRSYYKCTSAGCTVRKHVERASHDLKSVITTYEGKHNHEVPAARNSSHASSGSSGNNTSMASQNHTIHRRPDSCQVQENFPRFDAPVAMGNFGLTGREQLGPHGGFSFGLVQPGLSNLTMSGLSSAAPLKMLPPLHSYPGLRPLPDAGFMIPKGEPKEEPSESNLLIPSGASAVYQQFMSRLPLGPQL